MLRFYTAGESHGQALLAFISGLPAQLPIDVKFIDTSCAAVSLAMDAAAGKD